MSIRESHIEFTLIDHGQSTTIVCYENEYRNLMVLLKDKVFPEDFGECGGMGRCGTCLVRVSGDHGSYYKNEQATLLKMGVSEPDLRLACQVQIDEHLRHITVELFEGI